MSPSHPRPPVVTRTMRALARTPRATYAAVVAPVALLLVAVALQPWLPPSHLLRDSQVVAIAHGNPHAAYGLVSNLGILVMALTSGAALLGWIALRAAPGRMRSLLGGAGLLSLAVVLDDLLLLHETFTFATWARLAFIVAYAGAFAWFLVRFRALIEQRLDLGLLVLAGAALGSSLLVDAALEATQLSVLLEDGAKLLGFVAWSAFVVRAALVALGSRADAAGGAPPTGLDAPTTAATRHPSTHPSARAAPDALHART